MKEYKILYENDDNVLLEIFNYLIYYDKNNIYHYEVIKEENEGYKHIKNCSNIIEGIRIIADNMEKKYD